MNEVLNLSDLRAGSIVSGDYAYINNYRECTYDNGNKSYITGTITQKGINFTIKIWDSNIISVFKEINPINVIVAIWGNVKEYRNNLELTVQKISFTPECSDKSLFIKSVDVSNKYIEFVNFVNNKLTTKGVQVVATIFNTERLEDFKNEYAGAKMHDAQVGGLLNHTLKMLKIAEVVSDNDDRIKGNALLTDLMYLGIIFHDIGKTVELNNGNYTSNSYVTHITFGIEVLSGYRDLIISLYDEGFYYQLIAIILGHHGEYGDRPRTVFAYIIHLIDMLDSKVTGFFDMYDANSVTRSSDGNVSCVENGQYYTYPSENIMHSGDLNGSN